MSQNLPNMLDKTITKIKEMVDANTVVGQPIDVADNITIIPISKISVGFAGGGTDFVSKNAKNLPQKENPFGGGAGAGMKVTPVAFMVIKDGNVRMLPVATPPNTTADRIVEMIPDTLDRISDFFDSRKGK